MYELAESYHIARGLFCEIGEISSDESIFSAVCCNIETVLKRDTPILFYENCKTTKRSPRSWDQFGEPLEIVYVELGRVETVEMMKGLRV